jgi:hypothetical protein
MDKKKAIELLKQSLSETEHLKQLYPDKQEYELWESKVQDIIKASLDKDDINTFASAWPHYILTGHPSPFAHIERYQEEINMRELAIKKIIQKHELIGIEEKTNISIVPEEIFQIVPPKAFISHGKESASLRKLKEFIETLGIIPVIVKIQASLDKTVDDKVGFYLDQSDFVIILATADDEINGQFQPRQNVIHEIGLAQKTLPGKIIYLLEEGTEFPSNIKPKVYERFKQRNMMNAFLGIVRELRAYGMITVTKYPLKGILS